MNSNNGKDIQPASGAGIEVAERPAQDLQAQAARVEGGAHGAHGDQGAQAEQTPPGERVPIGTLPYAPYPDPATERPETPRPPSTPHEYTSQQVTQQPAQPAEQKGGNTALVVLLAVIGVVLFLGLIFVVAVVFVSNIVGQVTKAEVGELRTETQSVQLGGARSVVVDVSMGVGRLNISGGAADLMNSTFTYNVASWRPEVSYKVQGTEGTLLIHQPAQSGTMSGINTRYEWDVHFQDDVPMTMKVDVGVGDGELRFGGLNLSRLDVNSGVGDTTIDLTGQWKRDVDVIVTGGVGNVTILLPRETGVLIKAKGGLGNINASGLTVNGDTYTNSAYGTSSSTLNISVQTGIGNIELVQGK